MPDPTPPTDPIAPDARRAELETAVAALTRRAETAERERDDVRKAIADTASTVRGLRDELERTNAALADALARRDALALRVAELTAPPPPPTEVWSKRETVEEILARLADDPAPDTQYGDIDNRAARILWGEEREEMPELPEWEALKVPVRRRLMASAREYLASQLRSARLLRAALGV